MPQLDFFYPDEITSAMSFDSAPSSHPISVNVSSPAELSGLFDTISYRKVTISSTLYFTYLNCVIREMYSTTDKLVTNCLIQFH